MWLMVTFPASSSKNPGTVRQGRLALSQMARTARMTLPGAVGMAMTTSSTPMRRAREGIR